MKSLKTTATGSGNVKKDIASYMSYHYTYRNL
ncbi:hypothetical protein CLV60_104484 [Dyadobacter jiangsuensis]|uniref:Uncharacterized protein n=1 Tax=Dyadobacter jiangsuensis TaxID=1591085 RepID=A0A2P8G991_9BACT|nr:hypothetical protein CLV60_104484 [Dyadobacter jiangsuensis]